MANSLQVTQSFDGSNWTALVQVAPGSTLPAEIFLHENTGTTTLGDYVTVCNFDELARFQVWAGAQIPLFGNKYVRVAQAKIVRQTKDDLQLTLATVTAATKQLVAEFGVNSTTTITIPIN